MARWLTLLSIIAAIPPKNQADIIFVDDDAAPSGDGRTWATAHNNLQTALQDPNVVFGDEIWVAVGTYRPADPNGSRFVSFTLRPGIDLLGGFAADPNEPNRLDPNGVSILSGDLLGNDAEGDSNDPNRSENSIHVVDGLLLPTFNDPNGSYDPNDPNSIDPTATRLVRFTVQGGQADGSTLNQNGGGAGIITNAGRFIDCVFRWNVAKGYGGGALVKARASFEECTFFQNHAARGGGWHAFGVAVGMNRRTATLRCASNGGPRPSMLTPAAKACHPASLRRYGGRVTRSGHDASSEPVTVVWESHDKRRIRASECSVSTTTVSA